MAKHALDFTTSHTYAWVSCPTDLYLENIDWTVEFWFNVEAWPLAWQDYINSIVGIRDSADAGTWTVGLGNSVEANQNNLTVIVDTGSGYTVSVCTYELSLDTWYHAAATFDYSEQELKVYIDGDLKDTFTSVHRPVKVGDKRFTLGTRNIDYSGWNYAGKTDELRISNVIRYSSSFTVPSSQFSPDENTLGLWHMNEGSGTTVGDSSDNSYDLAFGADDEAPTWITGHVSGSTSYMKPYKLW